MLKFLGLLVGLAVVAGMRAEAPETASGASSSAVVNVAAAPPLYATRDVFSALGAPRP